MVLPNRTTVNRSTQLDQTKYITAPPSCKQRHKRTKLQTGLQTDQCRLNESTYSVGENVVMRLKRSLVLTETQGQWNQFRLWRNCCVFIRSDLAFFTLMRPLLVRMTDISDPKRQFLWVRPSTRPVCLHTIDPNWHRFVDWNSIYFIATLTRSLHFNFN